MLNSKPPGWPIVDLAQAQAGTHFVYPNTCKPCFVLPLDRHARKAGLSFFIPLPSRALLFLRWLYCLTNYLYEVVHLAETKFTEAIKVPWNKGGVATVIKLGTPGPHAKNTVLFLDSQHVPLAIMKIGNTEMAAHLLKNEARWLEALSNNSHLLDRCPKLVETGQLDDGYIIVQSVGVGRFSGYGLSDSHIEFLTIFQSGFLSRDTYKTSKMHKEMYARFSSLNARLSQAWIKRAQWALDTLEVQLGARHITMTAAHRDFTPWNTRLTPRGVFVFDWEYASEGYLPLYDLFHFLLLPIAVKNDISSEQIKIILKRVSKYGSMLGNGANKIEAAEFQLLAYLLDLSLMYLESRDGKDFGYVILNRYAKLIDSFDRWKKR